MTRRKMGLGRKSDADLVNVTAQAYLEGLREHGLSAAKCQEDGIEAFKMAFFRSCSEETYPAIVVQFYHEHIDAIFERVCKGAVQ